MWNSMAWRVLCRDFSRRLRLNWPFSRCLTHRPGLGEGNKINRNIYTFDSTWCRALGSVQDPLQPLHWPLEQVGQWSS